MTNLDYLIKELLLENTKYSGIIIPTEIHRKILMYYLLVTLRVTKKVSEEYIIAENEFLQEILKGKKVIDVAKMRKNILLNEKIFVKKYDISLIKCDAIIYPSDEDVLGCFEPLKQTNIKRIFNNAGVLLRQECFNKMNGTILPIGKSLVTDAYNLPCKNIIHSVFPKVFSVPKDIHFNLVKECIINALTIAKNNNFKILAISLPNYEEFNFPLEKVIPIYVQTINSFIKNNNCFTRILIVVESDLELELTLKCFGDKNGKI